MSHKHKKHKKVKLTKKTISMIATAVAMMLQPAQGGLTEDLELENKMKNMGLHTYHPNIDQSVPLDERRLPALIEYNQIAGMYISDSDLGKAYGPSMAGYSHFFRDLASGYHKDGDTWGDDRLKDLFFSGLYGFYSYDYTGIDPTYNYYQLLTMTEKPSIADGVPSVIRKHDIRKINEFSIYMGIGTVPEKEVPSQLYLKDLVQGIKFFDGIYKSVQSNKVFANLGADFQRDKIRVEKLRKQVTEAPADQVDKLFAELMILDRKNTDEQTLIYHWTRDMNERAMAYLRDYFKINRQAPDDMDPIFESIVTDRPDYTALPVYAALLRE